MAFFYLHNGGSDQIVCPHCQAKLGIEWNTEYAHPMTGDHDAQCPACGKDFKFDCSTEYTVPGVSEGRPPAVTSTAPTSDPNTQALVDALRPFIELLGIAEGGDIEIMLNVRTTRPLVMAARAAIAKAAESRPPA